MSLRHTLFAALLVPAVAVARPPGLEDGPRPEPPSVEERVDRLVEHLDLDAAQAEAVSEILAGAHDRARDLEEQLRDAHRALRDALESGEVKAMKRQLQQIDDLRDRLHALRTSTDDAVRAELTVEQQARFALVQMRRGHRRPDGPR